MKTKSIAASIGRRAFLAAAPAGVGGWLLKGAGPGAAQNQGSGGQSAIAACPEKGPLGQVTNPRNKNLNLLPAERLPWDGVEARLAVQDAARCQFATPKDLAPRGPECQIQDILSLDPTTAFQEMLGFGGTIIDSDVWNLMRLSPERRREAIAALSGGDGLGFNLMRIGFGSTDWNRDWNFYTYCDVPAGETDPKLTRFSVDRDVERGIIGVLREFLEVNPETRILASVWGVPAWMTTNKSLIHGFFDSAFTEVYADYLVKSIQAYARLGIPIHYLTVQNEPVNGGDRNTPAAMWTWAQQRDVLLALGDRFAKNRLDTKLWLMDQDFSATQMMAKPLLDDPRVKRIAHMVAYHDYGGRPEEMALLLRQHPEVPAVLTERDRGNIRDLGRLVDILANGATGHISWTTVADEWGGPYQWNGGSGRGTPSADYERMTHILIVPQREQPPAIHRTVVYYGYQTFSPLIRRGAKRIAANPLTSTQVSTAAFRNPDGSLVAVVVNNRDQGFDMAVARGRAALLLNMPAHAILGLRFRT